MMKDPSRIRVAIADPSHFGQTVLFDLLYEEGVRDLVKVSTGRELLSGLVTDPFDLVLVDDNLPHFSCAELSMLAKTQSGNVTQFVALQSEVSRESVAFLREAGVGGYVLKPIAPKRFSAVFRTLYRPSVATTLAA